MKQRVYVSVLLDINFMDTTSKGDLREVAKNKMRLQLDGYRGMKVLDFGHVLLVNNEETGL